MSTWKEYIYENKKEIVSNENLSKTLDKVTRELIWEYELELSDLLNTDSLFYFRTQKNINDLNNSESELYRWVAENLPSENISIPDKYLWEIKNRIKNKQPLLNTNYIENVLIPNYTLIIRMLKENIWNYFNFVVSDENFTESTWWQLNYLNISLETVFDKALSLNLLALNEKDLKAVININRSNINSQSELESIIKHELRHLVFDKDPMNIFLIISKKRNYEVWSWNYPFYEIYPRVKRLTDYIKSNNPEYFTLWKDNKRDYLNKLWKSILWKNPDQISSSWETELFTIFKIYNIFDDKYLDAIVFLIDSLAELDIKKDLNWIILA